MINTKKIDRVLETFLNYEPLRACRHGSDKPSLMVEVTQDDLQ